jgi:putative transposase
VLRRGVSPERVREVLEKRGKLTLAELVRCKVRYFSDGAVIGTKEFVEEVFEGHRGQMGAKRKSGARRIGVAEGDLHSLRDLKKDFCVDAP